MSNKYLTFSFDDGATQDIKLTELFRKYGLKATFNINSELLNKPGELMVNGERVNHGKVRIEDFAGVYDGFEVAAHTLTHPMLPPLPEDEIIRQVEQDRLKLSELVGYEVVGMAYPGGGVNNDARVASIVEKSTGVKYARTIVSTHSFDRQSYLYRFNPTVAVVEPCLFELAEKFLALPDDEYALFYVWGHSFEFDGYKMWDKFEDFCRLLAGRSDINYVSNREILLG